jgi:predicted kinase
MAKLIMCIGLPGSGKSTWAADQKSIEPELVTVVNKDSIRRDLEKKGWVWSQENEKDVIKERDKLIREALDLGLDVISDDTNLAPKHQNTLKMLAIKAHAKFEVKDFRDVNINLCIDRDSQREGKARVGRSVIVKMATDYLNYSEPTPKFAAYIPNPKLRNAVICDLDGTLAIHDGRSPFDYSKCGTDKLNVAVNETLHAMVKAGYDIVFVSGRDDSARELTQAWLNKHTWDKQPLFMRKAGDSRKDWIVKGEIFDAEIRPRYNVVFCLDDRDQVVKFYRELGLTVFQVNYGAF